MLRFLFVSVFLALYGCLNYYIGLRGWQYLGSRVAFLDPKVYWGVVIVLVLSSLAGTAGSRLLPDSLRSSLYLMGSYWIAAMAYFLLAFVLLDLARFLGRWAGFWPAIEGNPAFPLPLGLAAVIIVAVLLVYGTWNARNLNLTSYNVNIAKQAGTLEQLRIVLISDLHLGPINDQRQKRIIDQVNSLNPDLVLIPGDITDDIGLFAKLEMAADLRKIRSRYGVYASLGNHDYYNRNMALLQDQLEQAEITLLQDRRVKVADSFYLIGREDRSSAMVNGTRRRPLAELTQGSDPALPAIMLVHQPTDLEEAAKAGIDLQLSAHTHKGQFAPVNLITDRLFPVDYGYLNTGKLQVIVTSGAATWGPPIRIGSNSEVVEITVSFGTTVP